MRKWEIVGRVICIVVICCCFSLWWWYTRWVILRISKSNIWIYLINWTIESIVCIGTTLFMIYFLDRLNKIKDKQIINNKELL